MRRQPKLTPLLITALLSTLGTACGTDSVDPAGNTSTSDSQSTSDQDISIVDDTPQNGVVEIDVNGLAREYRLYVPTNRPEGPMPLLVAVHGADGRYEEFPQQARFSQLAEAEGFVIAYPLAELQPGQEGEWLLNTAATSTMDIQFIAALVEDVSNRHSIDAARVYATGYSLGSMFTYEIACHLSTRFAAVASFAGTMPVSPALCDPVDPVGIMHIHGVEDGIIAYGNSWDWKEWDSVGTMMDIPSLIDYWQDKLQCQSNAEDTSGSEHIVHEGCDGNVRVEHHGLSGVDHGWPQSINGRSTHEVVWSFLSDFSKS